MLGITGEDGLYTDLGLLLSDQCAHTLKFAVFNGTKKGEFRTRREMDGSLLRQMWAAFDFLSLSNNLAATISGLYRIEFVSLGGLMPGLRTEDLFVGISLSHATRSWQTSSTV